MQSPDGRSATSSGSDSSHDVEHIRIRVTALLRMVGEGISSSGYRHALALGKLEAAQGVRRM